MHEHNNEADDALDLDGALDTAVRRTRRAQEAVESRIVEDEAPTTRDAATVVHRASDLEELAADAADESVRHAPHRPS